MQFVDANIDHAELAGDVVLVVGVDTGGVEVASGVDPELSTSIMGS